MFKHRSKNNNMRLSILDQSHIPKNGTPEDALQATTALAVLADKLG